MATTMTAVHPVMHASAVANAANDNSEAGASTISANDFLTLLVTEMKNQDPTAQTDPNEYINQLVQVNSLQQLIQINQELSLAVQGASDRGTDWESGHTDHARGGPAAIPAVSNPPESRSLTGETRSAASLRAFHAIPTIGGNLSVPTPIPAAQQLAQALSGRP
jgi:flagellar basal-body rod modification protein FlgD